MIISFSFILEDNINEHIKETLLSNEKNILSGTLRFYTVKNFKHLKFCMNRFVKTIKILNGVS